MNAASRHRGPDSGGALAVGFAALGMNRLAIVDIEHGEQPMRSPDGDRVLVYNGELYDYELLRTDLAARGYEFRTRSDTEVLLASLLLDGETCLPRLNGMFSFALATASGIALAKLLNLFCKNKVNPLIGSAGVSAVPMSARVSQMMAHREDPHNFILMHAMGPNVAGVIGTAVAAGVLLSYYAH